MLETAYPSEVHKMSQFTDSDWIPQTTVRFFRGGGECLAPTRHRRFEFLTNV